MKKYLIFGATGLIGKSLVSKIHDATVIGYGSKLDICNKDQIIEQLNLHKPEVVFFCANNSGGVDACEKNPEITHEFHFLAVANIVEACKKNKSSLVFLSSTFVHGDKVGDPPLSQYGKAKLQAENFIKDHLQEYLIIRTANVFGPDEKSKTPNFYQQVLNHLNAKQIFKAPDNVLCTPTDVTHLTLRILIYLKQKNWGTHLIIGDKTMTRFEWAKLIGQNSALIEATQDHTTYRPKNQRFTNNH